MKEHIIALDAMGGDNAPEAIVAGGVAALRNYPDIRLLLAGPEARLNELLAGAADVRDRIGILPADEVISMEEAPMLAVRRKVNSSLVQAMLAVRDGRAGAVVSAGSTGAVLAGGMLRIGRIPGIERPALAPILPGAKKPFLLIDCGANVDCQPKYLTQFGLMGSVYMKSVMGVEDPAVGLVNIGTEEEKGNKLAKETFQMMKAQSSYRFAGNCEAREIPSGAFDVVVTDGFVGNVILKYTEGIVGTVTGMLKRHMLESKRTKLGAALAKPAFRAFKKDMDYNSVGGAPMLGVQGAVVKAHGSSGETAIMNAVRQAREMLAGDVVGRISEGLVGLDGSAPEN
ncbi:MAG: phosphate acyltransferase PlsX [Clostridia bacterium]|nr:phosphate acyltransferase PlsX [Clostridia bacterium]